MQSSAQPGGPASLSLAFGALIALILAVVGVGVWAVRSVNQTANHRYVEVAVPLSRAARDLQMQMINEQSAVRGYLITTDQRSLAPYRYARPRVEHDLQVLGRLQSAAPAIAPLVTRTEALIEKIQRLIKAQIARVESGPAGLRAARARVDRGRTSFDKFRERSRQIIAAATAFTAETEHRQDNTARDFALLVIALGAAGAMIAGLLAYRTTRRNREHLEYVEASRDREHEIAHVLQQSLLPARIPDVPGLTVQARFRPVGEGVEMGGDFYDVFETRDGLAVVVGDVCGKGPSAARLTALCRNTIRALALEDEPPRLSGVLSALNRAIVRADGEPGQFCTVAMAMLRRQPDGQVGVEIVSGGHPPVLIRRTGGTVEAIERLGGLVGIDQDATFASEQRMLAEGDVLVLYTDGVIDARSAGNVLGEDGLRDVVGAADTPDAIVEQVDAAVMASSRGAPPDDVALVVVQVSSG